LTNVVEEHVKSRMSNVKQGGESVVHNKPEYAVRCYDVLLILGTDRQLRPGGGGAVFLEGGTI